MKKRTDISDLQKVINQTFVENFGRTPLRQRLEDIGKESIELCRYIDMHNLKEETGDLLASTLALCAENDWDAADLIHNTLIKIDRRKLQYKTLGRKVYVAILGGAFNPITHGHIKLAQFVLNTSQTFDEVWLSPCFGHMYGKDMATPEQRLEMCRIAAKVDGRIKICDYEIINQLKGETYHFVKRIMEEDYAKDKYDFSYIVGLDNANTFDKWVNYKDLERMMRFVVVGRQGVKRDEDVDWYLKPPHIYLTPDKKDIPEVSSTQVRQAMRRGDYKAAQAMLDPDVYKFVYENGLYRDFCRD